MSGLGSIYTPPNIAKFLISWAIQSPKCKLLDMGIGEGVIAFAAYRQLRKLGATSTEAQHQIYGAEIDRSAYNQFSRIAKSLNISFPNLHNTDFFDTDYPLVDAIVGNPPYVRRTYIKNVDQIRQKVIAKNQAINQFDIPRLTDLYIYFLLYASAILKPEGRLAVITSDSWLNVGYGKGFKKYLQRHFEIDELISFDRGVFNDAQVKPVIILATKKNKVDPSRYIYFNRIKNGLPIDSVQQLLAKPGVKTADIIRSEIKSSELKADNPWGVYFKTPEIYEKIVSHHLMTPMANLAETRIGIQTLAKDFFVLTSNQAKDAQIEPDFLEPLALSSRYFNEPTIEPGKQAGFYAFYCSKSKKELRGTYALKYILQGERAKVEVRGKKIKIEGYHNKERIKKANRKFWYDLKTSIDRRGRAFILIPRLVYRTFTVVWNQAQFVPGELFIEFLPHSNSDTEVYLSVLTASITEMMLRTHAQVYGGGTYNINPGEIKKVPILNVGLLKENQKEELKQVYLRYLADKSHDRKVIDDAIYKIIGFDTDMQQRLQNVLADLLLISTSSKQPSSTDS